MLSHFQKRWSRAAVWPALAALLLFAGLIGTIRADRRIGLSAEEMNSSRGADAGQSIILIHCDGVGGNKKRVAACDQNLAGVGAVCVTCNGGYVKTVGGPVGGSYSDGEGITPCGKTQRGVCQAKLNRFGLLKEVRCTYPVGGRKGKGCVPGPSKPQLQSIIVAGPGPGE